ncbi:MAG: glycerophosphodiester phosphodiesterase [Pseudobdellovibrio sp.]
MKFLYIHLKVWLSCFILILSNPIALAKNKPASISYNSSELPLVIGHRGASGYRPEHTLEAYKLALDMGADYIEPDLVITKDGVLISRHENEISETTDVAIKYPDRKTTKKIDGENKTGWFAEDFTLKEIKTLRTKERLPNRDQKFNGLYEVPTFEEIIELLKTFNNKNSMTRGIYPETKHPSYFQSIGLALEEPLVKILNKYHLNNKNSKVFIQSFELSNLKKLKKITSVPLILLLEIPQKSPYDFILSGDKRTYLDLVNTDTSLKELSLIVSGIGPHKAYIIPILPSGQKLPPTELVKKAHTFGLKVHPYTFRNDKQYLHSSYENNPELEYMEFFKQNVDGVFSDFPDTAIKAREKYLSTLQR